STAPDDIAPHRHLWRVGATDVARLTTAQHSLQHARRPHARRPMNDFFKRYLTPGLAFVAAVIGGGYATGRELVEFFLPAGAAGGLLGMVVTMLVWSLVLAASFELARRARAFDYRSFFKLLLG